MKIEIKMEARNGRLLIWTILRDCEQSTHGN